MKIKILDDDNMQLKIMSNKVLILIILTALILLNIPFLIISGAGFRWMITGYACNPLQFPSLTPTSRVKSMKWAAIKAVKKGIKPSQPHIISSEYE